MANKQINARVALKHDIEQNWITAGEHDFCPMAGEVIIYDIEEGVCSQLRYKIGRKDSNGQLININDLPFESNVYVGRDEPTNAPAGFMWVDTSDEVKTITFYIENCYYGDPWNVMTERGNPIEYTAEEGMTFREWVDSEYNVDSWRCNTEYEETPDGNHRYGLTHDYLGVDLYGPNDELDGLEDCDSEIIPDYTYYTQGRP